jgi:MoaA/NifB/PqqE/SkfB family radical SAM enzyme
LVEIGAAAKAVIPLVNSVAGMRFVLILLMRYSYLLSYCFGALIGRKKPILAGVKLTHECNLACVHCPFRKKKTPALTFDQAVSSFNALHHLGVRIIIIEGGEPFLWKDGDKDLNELVREARRFFFNVGVTTNGTFPLDAATDIVWVSIDGMKQTHDRIRGTSFDRIMQNISESSHERIFAHITINSMNWEEVPEIVRFLAGKVKGITVQFHYPFEESEDSLILEGEKRAKVLDQLMKLKRQGLPVSDSYACLKALKKNRWKCRPWMIASVDPGGKLTHGCYVKDRGRISCEECGFSAHTEISLAYGGSPGALLAGLKIFGT